MYTFPENRPLRPANLFCGLVLALMSGAAAAGPAEPPAGPADAAPTASADSDQRVRQDMQAAVSHMAESGALGQHPEQTSMRVELPARRVANLGALVDSTSAQNARDGLHVLGATPGSAADRLGLRPGDVIVAVNGTSLRDLGADEHGRALAASTLRSVIDALPDSATVSLDVVRGGATLALNAPLQAVHVPAMRVELGDSATLGGASPGPGGDAMAAVATGCGRISAFDVAPRGQRLYGVRILLIDGTTPGPFPTPSFRVAAGEHHVLVAENIPTRELGVGEIATLRRQTSKPLTVVVQPGRTAMVAAQLHPGNASDLSHGTYWDPVVWKQIDEPCG